MDHRSPARNHKASRNAELRRIYDHVYSEGEESFFSKFQGGLNVSEADDAVMSLGGWEGRRVLDVGCGTGSMVRRIAGAGAAVVVGIDYSKEAISIAEHERAERVEYVVGDILDYEPEDAFDVVVTMGTLEHMDDPRLFFSRVSELMDHQGKLRITCPHFLNLRGFVWMALAMLLEVPMSLTDVHFIHPWDVESWAAAAGFAIDGFHSVDHDRANGEWLLEDFARRLPNALRDAGLETKGVPHYLQHIQRVTTHLAEAGSYRLDGATAVYELTNKGKGDR